MRTELSQQSTKISIMLAIDVVFFIVELGTGFWVHSLALMADAFHMLNDIISLVIGLWAVKAAKNPSTDRYSYGWLRAEILGAFFNAVFLIALCVSIILEAITRLVEPPEITNPELILIVGCFGLASNLVGFLVLGGHGHDHGPGGHDHDHDHEHGHEHAAHDHDHAKVPRDPVSAAEEGRGYSSAAFADDSGPAMDVLPHVALARAQAEASAVSSSIAQQKAVNASRKASGSKSRERRRAGSTKHSRLTSIDDLSIHPSSFRQEILEHSLSNPHLPEPDSEDDSTVHSQISEEDSNVDESSSLIKNGSGNNHGAISHSHSGKGSSSHHSHSVSGRSRRDSGVHTEHNHNKPKDKRKKSLGHDHGDMGMNAMVLHVIGDALGNVGVIITALIIWLTDLPGKFYADPAVSLFITAIILRSAIPLTKATSKVLLQATPDHIDLRDIKDDIQNLPGVISCHHVHIWQLSDTKVVASMHVQIEFPITEDGGEKYMKLARQARKCLHAYGIHSATIQPEFCVDESCKHSDDGLASTSAAGETPQVKCGAGAVEGVGDPESCLLECVDNCAGDGCCPTSKSKMDGSRRSSSSATAHDHEHGDHDGHDHGDHGHSHDH
ncbi:cation efflux protein [Microdochium trichocladiopsis]|uniref:Cation efflux protein n=1 Tax=Microdochium trichocladiopsis TaxID=1682393 RepID=A0A9P8Y2I0_9PEZI|nr:cation efflux protein [Microdochium trichocladiopsis]KAH7027693.1 cation efflux protein [Microdochium trichocladiopsis]